MTSVTIKPEIGWHPVVCDTCGDRYAIVGHYGGENLLVRCDYCSEINNECIKCSVNNYEL